MTRQEEMRLRTRVRLAIKEEGLVALAVRLGMQPRTLTSFAHGAVRSHRGTVAQIAASFPATHATPPEKSP